MLNAEIVLKLRELHGCELFAGVGDWYCLLVTDNC